MAKAWSGSRFTATNLAKGTTALWEARADGRDMHLLFPGWTEPPSECCGCWTADGEYYVFLANREGSLNLWMARDHSSWWRKNSTAPVQLTVGPPKLSNPLPSVGGKTLFVIGTVPRAELVRDDSKSGDFVPHLNGMSAGDLEFSRDGQWITYVTYPERILWRSKQDGSDRLQLTYSPMTALLPHWSPNGRQIAFMGKTPGKPWKVFLVSAEGGSAQANNRRALAIIFCFTSSR